MRILWLKPAIPYPPDTGGKMDTFFMVREFSRMGHEIVSGIVYFGGAAPEVPTEYSILVKEIVFLPGNMKPLHTRLLGSLADDIPFKFRKYYSGVSVGILADRLKTGTQPDIILVDHLHLAPLVLDARKAVKSSGGPFPPIILRTPNVESTIVRKYAERVDNPLIRAFASREARKMRDYETKILGEMDLVAAISPVDQAVFQKMSGRPDRVICVTAGMDVDEIKPASEPPTPGEVVLVGSFDWQPNVDGATWLVEKVWPIVSKRFPDAHLSLVGRKPPPYLEKLAGPGITLTGHVESVRQYVEKACCCVVPLWIGSGMRYKILEAFSFARAVVSTSLGAEGIDVKDGESILIRDDPEAFADAVIRVLTDPEFRDTLGMNGRQLVEEKYSWPKVAGGFAEVINCLL